MNKDNKKIKKYDERKILAIGYYYCSDSISYGKKIESCKLAGYSNSHSEQRCKNILELERVTDAMKVHWDKLSTNLIIINNILVKWLDKLDKSVETVDIRELTKLIRLIGDLQGKFIKREMKVTATKEEKHIYHHFDSISDEIKYHNELRSIANKRLKELNK